MDEPWQVAMAKMDRRDIDRNGQRLRPGCGFATGLAQNPFAHRDDETALFGDRDKRTGWDHAAFWTLPAGQCFKPDGLPRLWQARRRLHEWQRLGSASRGRLTAASSKSRR